MVAKGKGGRKGGGSGGSSIADIVGNTKKNNAPPRPTNPPGSQSYQIPPGTPQQSIPPRDPYGVTVNGVTTWSDGRVEGAAGGGGGGGGGAAGAPIAPALPPMSFDDFVAKDFTYNQARNEGGRRLQEFDAQTLLQRQQTEAEQQMQRAVLQQTLSEMGGDWANDAAGRGILRSGLYLQGQDKVTQAGVRGNQDIDSLLTQLLTGRQQDRVGLEQGNRNILNEILSNLSQQYNNGLAIG